MVCGLCGSASLPTPLAASTPWPFRTMRSTGSLSKSCPIRHGFATSPTSAREAVGFTWQPCWTGTPARWWGWAMSPGMPAGLVCAALQMAIVQRNPAPGLIVHSDRGTQYASAEHQALLVKHGLVGSMSRKGNCWDNAVMERFFLNLKMERVWQKDYANHAEAINDIADYMVGFYNNIRLHSTLGNMSPNAFERESTSKNLSSCLKLLDHYKPSNTISPFRVSQTPSNIIPKFFVSFMLLHPLCE